VSEHEAPAEPRTQRNARRSASERHCRTALRLGRSPPRTRARSRSRRRHRAQRGRARSTAAWP